MLQSTAFILAAKMMKRGEITFLLLLLKPSLLTKTGSNKAVISMSEGISVLCNDTVHII